MIGDILDNKYRIVRLLGQGGMGSVYEAVHVDTGQRVAVKLIRSDVLANNVSLISRFKREVKAAKAIESPHIAQLIDAGTDPSTGAPFMVMEYLVGEDLHQLLNRVGPLPPTTALRIVAQICLGLQKAHEAHVTHRDIKPANIFLRKGEGEEVLVKILDFGIAKIKGDGPAGAETTGLTNTGSALGSPRYMSPEQVRGSKSIDSRTDIWSLGGVLYRALTGHGLHASSSDLVELAMAICTRTPTPVQELAPWISPEVAAIVDGALQIDPKDRFESALAMFKAIEPLLMGSSALSEEMLVPVGDAERGFVAPKLEKPAPKALLPLMTLDLDTAAPTPERPVPIPGLSEELTTKAEAPSRPRPKAPIAIEENATSVERPRTRANSRAPLVFAMVGGIALLGAGVGFLWPKARHTMVAPSASVSAPDAEKPDIALIATQARNSERMSAASSAPEDPTTTLALLREIEPGPPLPRAWDENTRAALYAGVAQMVLPHGEVVYSATYSPDGRRIVSGSEDKTVHIWNADGTGDPLILRGHGGAVFSSMFSPDGRRIVSASFDRTARIWNADGTGEPLVLRGHEQAVGSAVFSPDGRRIVSASEDKTVRIWNADGTGQPLVLRGHTGSVYWATWSADGRRIVSASDDKTIRVWNADGIGQPLILRGHEAGILGAAFSPDGRRIVSASTDKTVRIWNADGTGQPLVLRGHDDRVFWAAFSPDGLRIASASFDKTVRVWNADGTGPLLILHGHGQEVRSAGWSPDGRHIVSGSIDKTVRVWKVDGTDRPLVLHGHDEGVWRAAFSPDGLHIISASADKTVRIWNADGTGEPLVLRGHDDGVLAAAFSSDGRRIVSASMDKTVRIWNADGMGEPLVLRGHDDGVVAAAFSPDGRRIVSASMDKTVRIWNADGMGDPLILRGHEGFISWVAWSPEGQRIVSASWDGTVRVWNADGAGVPLILRGHQERVIGAAFSPNGRRIVSASVDNTVRVWNADGSGVPLVLLGHVQGARLRADRPWSPDGTRIVTASDDGTVRIWNADGAGEPIVLRSSRKPVNSASWSPDGKRIVAALEDKTILVFRDVEPFRDAEDPRLWTATTYCMPLDVRKKLLGFPEEQSSKDLERCQRRVSESRIPSASTQR